MKIIDRKMKYCYEVNSSNSICRFSTIPIKTPAYYFLNSNKMILKFIWRGKRLKIAITVEEKGQRGLILLDSLKSDSNQDCGTSESIHKQMNGAQQTAQKQTHTNKANWSLTKEQRWSNRERTVFSTNGAGTTCIPHWPYTFHKK